MKTPRPHARTLRAAAPWVIALAGLISLAGCDPRMAMYFLQPFEPTVPAPGPKLEGKKVVVVTHVVSSAAGEFPSRGPIPMESGVSRGAFKNKFLKVAAAEVSWHFVEHSPDDNIQDVKFNNR